MFQSARPDLLSFEPGYDQRAKKLSWLSSKPFCHAAAELSRSFLLGESIRDHCCSSGNCNQSLRWTSLGANAYDVQSEQLFALTCKRRVRYSLLKKVYEIPRSRWFAQRIFRFGGVWSTDLSFNQSPASCFCGSACPLVHVAAMFSFQHVAKHLQQFSKCYSYMVMVLNWRPGSRMHFLVYLLQENRSVRCALHFRHDIPEPKKFLVIVSLSGLHFVHHLKSFAFFSINTS